MIVDYKHIHIGELIRKRMQECAVNGSRASEFLKVDEEEIEQMLEADSLSCDILLRWSKLLEYDFFRIYTQHLILYSPQDINKAKRTKKDETTLPVFKKNIYTQEVINYLIELVDNGSKTLKQIQDEYNIPATTVIRWVDKYGKKSER